MKFTLICLLAMACAAQGMVKNILVDDIKYVDKDITLKQKFILDLLRHIHLPFQVTDWMTMGKTFVYDETMYTDVEKFHKFVDIYKTKMLPKGEIFSIYNKRHLMEVRGVFNLLWYSKDWTTLMKNFVWCRMHVNENMFVHALYAVVLHRTDLVGILLPPIYEVIPHKFITSTTITKGIRRKLTTDDDLHVVFDNKTIVKHVIMNKDDKLRYFTEDIGLNNYYFMMQMDLGFWLDDKIVTGLDYVRRGEKYLWIHHQLLARYYLERLSHDLGDIRDFTWKLPIKTGYFSNLRYYNGMIFPMRHNNFLVKTDTKRDILITKVMDVERRLRDVVERGYLILDDGKRIDFRDPKSIDLLGKIIIGCKDCVSIDVKFLKYLELYGRILLSGGIYTTDDYDIIPGVLEHFETSLRDPVFYILYKRILKVYFMMKDNLKSYTVDDLRLRGVKVLDVVVDKLVTYLELVDTDITNAVGIKMMDKTYIKNMKNVDLKTDIWKTLIHAKTLRLNHKPFTMKFDILADRNIKVVIRTFLGPKYDELGNRVTLKNGRENFVEIDKWVTDLTTGKNSLIRLSSDFYYTIPDYTTMFDLYKRVMTRTDVRTMMGDMKDVYCGFPDRLILPRGKVNGLEMRLFVVVSLVKDTIKNKYDDLLIKGKLTCGKRLFDIDDYNYGWPLDRKIIDDRLFFVDNMLMKDVFIYHKDIFGMMRNDVDIDYKYRDTVTDFDTVKYMDRVKDFDTDKYDHLKDYDTDKYIDRVKDFDTDKYMNRMKNFDSVKYMDRMKDFDTVKYMDHSKEYMDHSKEFMDTGKYMDTRKYTDTGKYMDTDKYMGRMKDYDTVRRDDKWMV